MMQILNGLIINEKSATRKYREFQSFASKISRLLPLPPTAILTTTKDYALDQFQKSGKQIDEDVFFIFFLSVEYVLPRSHDSRNMEGSSAN